MSGRKYRVFFDSRGPRLIGQDFPLQLTKMKALVFHSVQVPFVWKGTMQEDSVVYVKYSDDSLTGTFTVPAGNYDSSDFVASFTSLTGSASTILGQLSWSYNVPNSRWVVTNAHSTLGVVFDYTNQGTNSASQEKHLKRAFGSLDTVSNGVTTEHDTQTWAANTTTTSTSFSILTGCSHLKILPTDELLPYLDTSRAKTNKSGPSDFFVQFWVTVNPGGTVNYEPLEPVRIPFKDYTGALPFFNLKLLKEDTFENISDDTTWNATLTFES